MLATKQKIVFFIAGMLLGALTILAAQYARTQYDKKANMGLNALATEINTSLPMMVDKETQLTTVAGLNKKFVYNYKLVNLEAKNISMETLMSLKPGMIKASCTTPETRDNFLNKGVTMQYKYYDKNNVHISDIDIVPADCGF